MKKIAVILNGPIINDGRVQRSIKVMLEYFDVDLFYLNGSEHDKELFANGKGIINLISFKHDDEASGWLKRNFSIHNSFTVFEKKIKDLSKYDVIFCNDYPTLYYGCEAKKLNPQLKLIYDSHEIFIETFNQFYPSEGIKGLIWSGLIFGLKKFHHRKESEFITKIDRMITVNSSLENYFKEKFKVDSEAVYNVPFLEDTERNVSIREKLNLDENDKIILYQGVLNDGRGLTQLVETFSFLPANYHLVIIGYGVLENKLKKLAADLKLKNVHFLGKVNYEDLHSYTKTADLGVFLLEPLNLSKKLSSANKIFEYMKAGLPVLTTDQPENKKVVDSSGCGLLIKTTAPEKVAGKIREILENTEQYREMSENSLRGFLKNYNWDKEKQKLEKILIEI